ncbi:MAG: Ribonuclease Y [candidate division TM6 bacterium GW2011_GWF2_43_87]|nr:MAG: Ribonuclease Y [candidate division TM6 bacterium GW2011_GWF2_43_87]
MRALNNETGGAMEPLLLFGGIGLFVVGGVFAFIAASRSAKMRRLLHEAELERSVAIKEMAAERKEATFKLKDELHKKRIEFKNELKREQTEVERLQSKLMAQKETIEEKEKWLGSAKNEVQQKERELTRFSDQLRISQEKIKVMQGELTSRLEKIAYMTQEEARNVLFETLETEVRHSSEKWLQKVEDDARINARERATGIVVDVMQRYASEYVSGNASCVVTLPNDDMKGRIIGKEGRNIKVLEMTTGVDIIIDDTPEIITVSGFNPIRREVARRSLEKLIQDGRINPTRIEETVAAMESEVEEIIQEKGKSAITKLNMHNVAPEIVSLLGQLHFRTSFSQDVLAHSVEVALMARMLAEELGLSRPDLAARAGLLHDIGKAVSSEHEGPHAQVGADVARRCGEDPIVVNAIAAHHEEVPFKSVYDSLVLISDTISAARPGARRETLAAYIKRLEKLEAIAAEFSGVKRAYALQAGREIRIVVEEDVLGDQEAMQLARDIARKVEEEVNFPGQIKINVIREKRAVEYAK